MTDSSQSHVINCQCERRRVLQGRTAGVSDRLSSGLASISSKEFRAKVEDRSRSVTGHFTDTLQLGI